MRDKDRVSGLSDQFRTAVGWSGAAGVATIETPTSAFPEKKTAARNVTRHHHLPHRWSAEPEEGYTIWAPEAAWMPLVQPPVQSACESQALAAPFLEEWLEPGPDPDEPLLCSLCSPAHPREEIAPLESVCPAHAVA